MNYLSAELLSKSFSERWLFNDISVGIAQGEKVVLVGENGTGKSTLLKILAGQLMPDSGNVVKRDGISVGYLGQQIDFGAAETVKDFLFSDQNEVARAVREYEDCLQDEHTSPERMQAALELMEELEAWNYDEKVKEVLSRLSVDRLQQPLDELSGGQRKRVGLAHLLLQEPDLIILDEPTNHLDLEAIEWLENFLSAPAVTMLMVSHDRYFVDTIATTILELDKGKLYRHPGNYAAFLERKTEREDALKLEVTKAKNLLRKELEWMRRQPKARGTKAKYRIEAYHELEKKASQSTKKDRLELDLKESRQGGKVLELHHVSKSFGETRLVNEFSYIFKKKDRIGVVGKNGIGKSTFLDLLTGKLKPDQGEIIPGLTTVVGYFTQESEDLNPAHRVIEEVKSIAEFITLSDGSQLSASGFLSLFLFPPEKQYTFIEKLSGGERKRLQLLKVLVKSPNFLVLDEPTNDFDLDTLHVLEEFLEKFGGCLVLVSHDRYFMDHLVDQLFVFEGEGNIRLFNGNYSDYRIEREEAEALQDRKESIRPEPPVPVKQADKRKPTFLEKQEYEKLPEVIAELEKQKAGLIEKLSNDQLSHEELTRHAAQIQTLTEDITSKTDRWLLLDELISG